MIEYYSAIKKNEIWPFVTSMGLEDIRTSEIHQRERQRLYVLPYV